MWMAIWRFFLGGGEGGAESEILSSPGNNSPCPSFVDLWCLALCIVQWKEYGWKNLWIRNNHISIKAPERPDTSSVTGSTESRTQLNLLSTGLLAGIITSETSFLSTPFVQLWPCRTLVVPPWYHNWTIQCVVWEEKYRMSLEERSGLEP